MLRGSRLAFLIAALVGLSAFVAVVVTRYLELPALGPIPNMYEPIWFFQKTLSAVAEAAVAVFGLISAIAVGRNRVKRDRPNIGQRPRANKPVTQVNAKSDLTPAGSVHKYNAEITTPRDRLEAR